MQAATYMYRAGQFRLDTARETFVSGTGTDKNGNGLLRPILSDNYLKHPASSNNENMERDKKFPSDVKDCDDGLVDDDGVGDGVGDCIGVGDDDGVGDEDDNDDGNFNEDDNGIDDNEMDENNDNSDGDD